MSTPTVIYNGESNKRIYLQWEDAQREFNQHCYHLFSRTDSRALRPKHTAHILWCIRQPRHPWTMLESQAKLKTEQAIREWNTECQKSVTFLKASIGPNVKVGLLHIWDTNSRQQTTDHTFRELYRAIQQAHAPTADEIQQIKREIMDQIRQIKPATNDGEAQKAFNDMTHMQNARLDHFCCRHSPTKSRHTSSSTPRQ